MIKNIKYILTSLCLTTFCHASADPEELKFNGRSEFYQWTEKGEDPKAIHFLTIHDLWSSRRFDYIPGQQFKDQDFALITQLFSNITYLKLNPTLELTDDTLKNLSNLPDLKEIHIKGDNIFERFTDNAFFIIAEAAPQLEIISLEGPFAKLKGDSFVEALEHFPQLESVFLYSSYHRVYFNDNVHKIGSDIKMKRASLHVFVNGIELE